MQSQPSTPADAAVSTLASWKPMAVAATSIVAVAAMLGDGLHVRLAVLAIGLGLLAAAAPRLRLFAPITAAAAAAASGVASGPGFWDDRMLWLALAVVALVAGIASGRIAARDRTLAAEVAALAASAEARSIRDAVNDSLGQRRNDNYVDREFVRAQRYGREVTVAVADVDNLALLREQRGGRPVEEALVALGTLFSDDTRLPDGGVGDELRLVFVLPETPLLGGRVVAERVRLGFQALRLEGADGVPLTVSIGVASYPGDGQRGSEVIAAAEAALDRAIARGGNRTVLTRSPAGTPGGWSTGDGAGTTRA